MIAQRIIFMTALLSALGLTYYFRAGQQAVIHPASSGADDVPPVLHIESHASLDFDQPLEFTWTISNPGMKPVCFYTSLLDHQRSAFAELNIDEEQKLIEVGFMRSKLALGLPPYSFPKATFQCIDPGQSLKGRFISEKPIGQLSDQKVVSGKLETIKLTPGIWTVKSKIAYGYEIETIKKALEESTREGLEHPINPIVRWQKVVHSEPVQITFQ